MTPYKFPEANTTFGSPEGLEESQVMSIPAYTGTVERGSVEGLPIVVVAWMPTDEERQLIAMGEPIFISMVGGLAPHFPCLSFSEAVNPA